MKQLKRESGGAKGWGRRWWAAVAALPALLAAGPACAAVVLTVGASGRLVGAAGVDVGGVLYEVAFVDGTCNAVFSDCQAGAPNAFAFQTQASAHVASQALIDQVFLDGPQGNFDSDLGLMSGCTSTRICDAITPYGTFTFQGTTYVRDNGARNMAAAGDGVIDAEINVETYFDLAGDLGVGPNFVWAVWTPATVTVDPPPATGGQLPLPGTLALVSLGLAALRLTQRRAPR
ncbi:MAG: hypothetical protein HY020_15070 [Burkholderiales bacterium]|nr:hypothetical protein [Burkholderiales bacterium]